MWVSTYSIVPGTKKRPPRQGWDYRFGIDEKETEEQVNSESSSLFQLTESTNFGKAHVYPAEIIEDTQILGLVEETKLYASKY